MWHVVVVTATGSKVGIINILQMSLEIHVAKQIFMLLKIQSKVSATLQTNGLLLYYVVLILTTRDAEFMRSVSAQACIMQNLGLEDHMSIDTDLDIVVYKKTNFFLIAIVRS